MTRAAVMPPGPGRDHVWHCRTCDAAVRFTYPAANQVEIVDADTGEPHRRCTPTAAVAARVDAQRERQRQLAQEAATSMMEGAAESWTGEATQGSKGGATMPPAGESPARETASAPAAGRGGTGHPPLAAEATHHPDGLPILERCPDHDVPYPYTCSDCAVAELNGWTGAPDPEPFVPDFAPIHPLPPKPEPPADELAARRAAREGLEQGQALAQEGADRAAAHAPYGWMEAAADAIAVVARCQAELTTDDVWREVGKPPEPRAMGAAMQAAQRAGIITKTDRVRPSTRPETHANPKAVWQSLTYETETPTCH